MSRKIVLYSAIAIAFLVTASIFQGCKKDVGESRKAILNIESKTISAIISPESGIPVECMRATEEGTNTVYLLDLKGIDGFTYETGYSYRLKVTISPVNPPLFDAPSITYKLQGVLSKTKVTEQ